MAPGPSTRTGRTVLGPAKALDVPVAVPTLGRPNREPKARVPSVHPAGRAGGDSTPSNRRAVQGLPRCSLAGGQWAWAMLSPWPPSCLILLCTS